MKDFKTTKICEIADIYSGYQVRKTSDLGKEGNISFIQVKDVDRNLHKVSLKNLERINMDKDMSKYRVEKEDVLFLAKGNISASLLIEEEFSSDETYIPMPHFFILRPQKSVVLKEYLCLMLNHKETQVQLKRLLRGTMMEFISRIDFENVTINLPSIERQKLIVDLAMLREKEKMLYQQIDQEKEKLFGTIINNLISENER